MADVAIDAPSQVLLVGATVQLAATPRDAGGRSLSDRSVTWTSSDPSKVSVSSTGLATALAPSSLVTVTARVEGVTSQVSLRVNRLTVRVPSDSLYVGEVRQLDLVALDENQAPSDLPAQAASPVWSSSSASVATVTSDGVVAGVSEGAATVSATFAGAQAQGVVRVRRADSVADSLKERAAGVVALPPNVKPAAVTVFAGMTGIASANSGGAFEVPVSRDTETMLVASANGRPVGLAVVAPGTPAGVRIDGLRTAVALVFLWPTFASAPAAVVPQLLAALEALPEVRVLGSAIDAAVASAGALPDISTASGAALYRSAIVASERAVFGSVQGSSASVAPLAPPITASGVELSWPTPASANMTITMQKRLSRDVVAHLEATDESGRPLAPTATGSGAYLGNADFVGAVTSLSFWVTSILTQSLDLYPAPVSMQVAFTPERSRHVVLAYGLGARGIAGDWTAMTAREGELARLLFPGLLTVTTGAVLPVIEAILGFRILGSGPQVAQIKRALLAHPFLTQVATGAGVVRCASAAQRGGIDLFGCLADAFLEKCIGEPSNCAQLIASVAQLAGHNIAQRALTSQLTRLNPIIAAAKVASAFGAIVQTGVAIGLSELRQEMDLSYHDLIGAQRLARVSGDGQVGVSGSALPNDIVVRAQTSEGVAVPNAWVVWTASGGGTTSVAVSTTDSRGEARVRWFLGSSGTQALQGRLTGTTTSVSFSASIGGGPPVTLNGRVFHAVTNVGIPSVAVTARRAGAVAGSTTTDQQGNYQLSLAAGAGYDITAAAAGYVPSTIVGLQLSVSLTAPPIPLVPASTQAGGITGRIINATNAGGVAGAVVELRSGINSTTGPAVATTSGSATGSYSFSGLPAGTYTVLARAGGFVNAARTGIAVGGSVVANQDVVLSPTGTSSAVRIVLSWGASPGDLDSHLTGPQGGTASRFRVFWSNRGSCSAMPFACLDVDDTNGFGPETITITRLTSGTYRYAVHNFSAGTSSTDRSLANSGARVDVYVGNVLRESFSVPPMAGTLWTVFTMDEFGTVTPVNTLSGAPASSLPRTAGWSMGGAADDDVRELFELTARKKPTRQ